MFTDVKRIKSDKSKTVHVTDALSSYLDGSAVATDPDGINKLIYKGNIVKEFDFTTSDLIIPNANNLIVSHIRIISSSNTDPKKQLVFHTLFALILTITTNYIFDGLTVINTKPHKNYILCT